MEATIEALQATPAFGGVAESALAYLLERGRNIARAPGEPFFLEGELGETFYLIQQGEVEIYKERRGVRRFLGTLGEGDCFGEMALLSVETRSASVVATSYCNALELTNASLFELYCDEPDQFLMIVMNLGREVCRRLRELNDRLLDQECAKMPAPGPSKLVDKGTTV